MQLTYGERNEYMAVHKAAQEKVNQMRRQRAGKPGKSFARSNRPKPINMPSRQRQRGGIRL